MLVFIQRDPKRTVSHWLNLSIMQGYIMVKVHVTTTHHPAAWRVRDALAAHPLLAGAMAQIDVRACGQGIVLEGWAMDEATVQLAMRIACRAAGQHAVQPQLLAHKLTARRKIGANEKLA